MAIPATVHRSRLVSLGGLLLGGAVLGVATGVVPGVAYATVMSVAWILLVWAAVKRGAVGASWLNPQTLAFGLAFRLVMAFAYIAIVWVFYGGAADFNGYQSIAIAFAEGLLTGEFWVSKFVPNTLAVIFGLMYFLVGPNLAGMFVVSALLGFLGAYWTFRAVEIGIAPGPANRRLAFALLFALPSFTLWTSVLGKESLALCFNGLVLYSLAKVAVAGQARYLLGILAGVAGAMAVRPAVGVLLLFCVLCSTLFRPNRPHDASAVVRPIVMAAILVGAVAVVWRLGLIAIAERFGSFGIGFAQEGDLAAALLYYHQGLAQDAPRVETGLGIQITEPTAGALLGYLPKAIFAFFFRPFVFEAHNVLALAAALESTLLLGIVLWKARVLMAAVGRARREPFVAFCWMATLALAAMLSMGSNFGVMIRQRGMVLPFVFVLLIAAPSPAREGAGAPGSRGG